MEASNILSAVILAAGAGRRAGGYKPLWPLGDELVIDRVIRTAFSICTRISVVGGNSIERLRSHLSRRHSEVSLVYNPIHEEGMFTSIQAGLRNIVGPVFIQPADIPGPGPQVFRLLAKAYQENDADVFCPVFGDRRGHPVLVSLSTVSRILASPTSFSLRQIVKESRCCHVPVADESILWDFNTKEDFEKLCAKLAIELPDNSFPLVLLVGPKFSGKSLFVERLVSKCHRTGLRASGFIQRGVFGESGDKKGYDLVLANSGTTESLARRSEKERNWIFSSNAFENAKSSIVPESDIIVIDEVGPMELEKQGHWETLLLALSAQSTVLAVVREELIDTLTPMLKGFRSIFRFDYQPSFERELEEEILALVRIQK